jgi:hypothetical protein
MYFMAWHTALLPSLATHGEWSGVPGAAVLSNIRRRRRVPP